MTIHDEQHEQEQEPEEYNKDDGLHDVFNKILLMLYNSLNYECGETIFFA